MKPETWERWRLAGTIYKDPTNLPARRQRSQVFSPSRLTSPYLQRKVSS